MKKSLNFNRKIHNLGLGNNNVSHTLSSDRILSAVARDSRKKIRPTGMSTKLDKMNNMNGKKKIPLRNDVEGDYFKTESEMLSFLSRHIRPLQFLGTHLNALSDPPVSDNCVWVDIAAPSAEGNHPTATEDEKSKNDAADKERLMREISEKELLVREILGREKLEKERLEKEGLEKERLEKEGLEKERLEKERLEKERLEKERLEKERLEIYLFNCYSDAVLPYIVEKYKSLYPAAIINILDNHSTSDVSTMSKLSDLGWRTYGDAGDFDYDEQENLYNTVWIDTAHTHSWVLLSPADTVVYITPGMIADANRTNTKQFRVNSFDVVGKSAKKELSDLSMRDLRTVRDGPDQLIACFNKESMPDISVDYIRNRLVISSDSLAEKASCNAYTYKYLGLSYYVSLSRSLHARQNRWRELGYKCCLKSDIGDISGELLSLGQTRLLEKLE